MKTVKLKNLTLTNYRNIPFATYEFNGNSAIVGDNRIGKTNTLESIYWLLTDRLLDGSNDIAAIKPLKDTKLKVSVKATFDIDGKEVVLEKNYYENWVKTRGTTDLELKGHCVDLFYNGVKQPSQRAYIQLLSEDLGFTQDATTKVDFMQMLTNPFYLGNMGEGKDWTELRNFIIKIVGDVSDQDVINSNEVYKLIKADLEQVNGRIDELKKRYAAEINELKIQQIGDESQIKMLEQTPNPTEDELAIANKGIEEHEDRIRELKNGKGIDNKSIDINNRINAKKLEIANLEKEDYKRAQANSGNTELYAKINGLQLEHNKLIQDTYVLESTKSGIDRNIAQLNVENNVRTAKRADLINELKKIDYKLANPEIETECPHCHRPYDDGILENMREIAVAKLQEERNSKIEEGKANTATMKANAEEIEKYNKQLAELEEQIKQHKDSANAKAEEIRSLQAQLNTADTSFEPNPKIAEMRNELAKLEEELNQSRTEWQNAQNNVNQAIYDEEEQMKPFKEVVNNREYYLRQMDMLKKVRETYDSHLARLSDAEQKKELLIKFNYDKLQLLDKNVERVFGEIKFQLIKENINGGFDTICKPYIKGTSTTWKSGSKSERVTTGIAIAECIKKALNLPNLPFLFDEGGEISTETLNTRMNTESQLICVKIQDNITAPLVQQL